MSASCCGIMARVSLLGLFLLIACISAASLYAGGIGWLVDDETGTFPLLHCPSFLLNSGELEVDGPRCVVRVTYSMINYLAIAQKGNLHSCEVDTESKIDCHIRLPCAEALHVATEDGLMCEA